MYGLYEALLAGEPKRVGSMDSAWPASASRRNRNGVSKGVNRLAIKAKCWCIQRSGSAVGIRNLPAASTSRNLRPKVFVGSYQYTAAGAASKRCAVESRYQHAWQVPIVTLREQWGGVIWPGNFYDLPPCYFKIQSRDAFYYCFSPPPKSSISLILWLCLYSPVSSVLSI